MGSSGRAGGRELVPLSRSRTSFAGLLPETRGRPPRTVKAGDVHGFVRGNIVDWLYMDRNRRRMHGNFTACALMAREPPKEAAALRKRLGLACKP